MGVGSFQYGGIRDCVQSICMMGVDGEAIELRGDSLELAVGAEGRTGMLLEIVLRLQPLARMEPLVAVFSRIAEMEACLAEVARRALPLWSASLMDRAAVDLQSRLRPKGFTLPQGRYAALFSFRAQERLQVLPKLRGCVLACGGKPVALTGDHDAWIDRFMGLQALGTTPVPMQFRLPLGKLAGFTHAIRPELRRNLAFEGVVADLAQCVTVRFFLLERPGAADGNLKAARELLLLAKQAGGEVYATGGFFLDQAEAVFGAELLHKMVLFRRAIDPQDRLNPGKAFGPPAESASR